MFIFNGLHNPKIQTEEQKNRFLPFVLLFFLLVLIVFPFLFFLFFPFVFPFRHSLFIFPFCPPFLFFCSSVRKIKIRVNPQQTRHTPYKR